MPDSTPDPSPPIASNSMPETGVDLANAKPGRLKTDDIPLALRETTAPVVQQHRFPFMLGMGLGLGAIALVALPLVTLQSRQPEVATSPEGSQSSGVLQPSPSVSPSPVTLLGHFQYAEAPASALAPVVADGSIKLRKAAAKRFQEMMAAARAENVVLVPLSGFRSRADQQHLFFDVKAERGQSPMERAGVSAPPGYSEHHTGYAIDIGDGDTPATNLSPSFEKTAAFKWLQANAAHYSFELSFPKGNTQGVTYEPWHWRFVGDSDSLETFYKARSPR